MAGRVIQRILVMIGVTRSGRDVPDIGLSPAPRFLPGEPAVNDERLGQFDSLRAVAKC